MKNPEPSNDFGAFVHKITKDLDDVTTRGAELPPKSDLSFHRTLDKEFSQKLDQASSTILAMAQELLELVDPQFPLKKEGFADPAEDLTDRYRKNVVPSVDGLLEQTDSLLDEMQGNKKKAAIQVKPELEALAKQKLPGPFAAQGDVPPQATSEKMRKPQLDFADPVDNSNDRPSFTPTLPVKHHAMVPLDFVPPKDYILPDDPEEAKTRLRLEKEWRRHPYFYETRHLPYPTSMFTVGPVIKPAPIETTEAIWVDQPEQLAEMVEELKQAKEIGVDLEHHDTHSYYGFTCLMQISTREKDWLIDTLALRAALREHKLGGVMADPSIVKVFHGADSDIVWLQKDFDIYVVNLFDTYRATKVLNIRPHSLANLLALYCGYHADKKYQMADWRLRPLSPGMKLYAQADTHFILSIYDNLRNALLEMSRATSPDLQHAGSPAPSAATNPQRAMREVLDLSAQTAMRIYSQDRYAENGMGSSGWQSAIAKSFQGKVPVESEVGVRYKRIHMWRDRVAREEDEGLHAILNRPTLESLAHFPPRSLAILRQRLGRRFPVAGRRSEELWKVISDAQVEWRVFKQAKRAERRSASPAASLEASPEAVAQLPIITPTVEENSAVKAEEIDTTAEEESAELLVSVLFPDVGPATTQRSKRASASGLFGSTITTTHKAKATPTIKRKAESTLFGSSKKGKAAPTPSIAESWVALDAIERAIAADMAPKPTIVEKAAAATEKSKLPEPETVPFVPAAERSTIAAAEVTVSSKRVETQGGAGEQASSESAEAETSPIKVESASSAKAKKSAATKLDEPEIVTVKKATKKSKKRAAEEPKDAASTTVETDAAAESAAPSAPATKKKRKTAASDVPDFDYSSVPNLLDNPKAVMAEADKKGKKDKAAAKKAKKDKPPAITGTLFGKMPQDMSQPKAGNKSKTFKEGK